MVITRQKFNQRRFEEATELQEELEDLVYEKADLNDKIRDADKQIDILNQRIAEVQSKIDGLQSYDDMLEDKGDRDYHAMRDEP
jgi:peptidoglycan hydrolase CwlO-like protein